MSEHENNSSRNINKLTPERQQSN